MRIALFGAPGVGKGSQAVLLQERDGLVHISTGVILRNAIRKGSPVGLEAKSYMEASQLVPGALVRALAEDAIRDAGFNDFVLDGYPRTLEQAAWLTTFLEDNDAPLRCVVNLKVADDLIVQRLSQRRVHIETGENFHLEFKPPPADLDPSLILQRDDDKPEAIRERLRVYKNQTHPLVEYYQQRGLLIDVDGVGSFQDVHDRIVDAVFSAASSQ